MARIGLTALEVEKAALQLQGQGKNPTVDNIRGILGTGSKTTIAQHLKTWRIKQGEFQSKLPQELTALVAGLWERINGQAEERIIEAENTSEKTIQELKQGLVQAQQEQTQLKTQLHAQEEAYAAEHQAKETLARELQEARIEQGKRQERHEALIHQLSDAKSENLRLHQLAKQIQANLEYYQAAVQQQRTEQSLAMEKREAQFQQEILGLQRELSDARLQNQKLNQELSQKAILLEQAESHVDSLQQEHDEVLKNKQGLDRELVITQEQSRQYQNQLKNISNELADKNHQLVELEKQLAILTHQNGKLKSDYESAAEKIETLRHEKMFLTQEKSELQGQLKYLSSGIKNNVMLDKI